MYYFKIECVVVYLGRFFFFDIVIVFLAAVLGKCVSVGIDVLFWN